MRKPNISGRMAEWLVKLSTFDLKYDPRSAIKSQALIDFVVDFSDDLQTEVEIETRQLLEEENMGRWTLFTNRASNQRGTSLGIILKSR